MRRGIAIFSFFLFIWGNLSALEEFPQIRCICVRIKEGCLEGVKDWLRYNQEHREESLETFVNEGVWMECAFIDQVQEDYYLIYFMRAEDIDKAREAFQHSTLPADDFHKECWRKFTHLEERRVFTPILHLERDELSCK